MSRRTRYARSLLSGYAVLGTNIANTLISVPLALHYLAREEFGLWALVMQITGYLALLDLGMSGSVYRIIIDHKDQPSEGLYGTVIKAGWMVLIVQGFLIAAFGIGLSFWAADLFNVPERYSRIFHLLIAGQSLLVGSFLPAGLFGYLLLAHQRSDANNYSHIVNIFLSFTVMLLGLHLGFGLFSLLFANLAGALASTGMNIFATVRLNLYPRTGAWGKVNRRVFQEVYAYARDIFLLGVGQQLISASQVIIVSRVLGLEAAAVWSIATKAFTLAQLVVFRILDFAGPALSEMLVRNERTRLFNRFHDILILTGSFSIWVAFTVGICNQSFLQLWTGGRIAWGIEMDFLMALSLIAYSLTRCNIGFIGITKQIYRMKYVYFLEGVLFVLLGTLAAYTWGMAGIISAGIASNLICSGLYGVWRVARYFAVSIHQFLVDSLWLPLRFSMAFSAIIIAVWLACRELAAVERILACAMLTTGVGLAILWRLGLTSSLRTEFRSMLVKPRC